MSQIVTETLLPMGVRVSLRQGDLTEERVDAIVNAANTHLQHGGGLAGAIVRSGGASIQQESDRIGYTATGTAAITAAGNLPAQAVIHAVGPIWSQYEPADADLLLASATEAALELASAKGFESLALPAISAGIYGFPRERCATVMLHALSRFLEDNSGTSLRDIRFVLQDPEALKVFRAEWARIFDALSN